MLLQLVLTLSALTVSAAPARATIVEVEAGGGRYTNIKTSALDGLPLMVYNSETPAPGGSVRACHCLDPLCTNRSLHTVFAAPASDPDGCRFIALRMSPLDGLPVVSFYGKSLRLVRCRVPNCSATDAAIVLDPAGGAYPSIGFGPKGAPLVAYYSHDDGLKLAVCQDAACSAHHMIVVASQQAPNAGVGKYPSLATNGNVLAVSFHNTAFDSKGTTALQIAVCTNLSSCTAESTSTRSWAVHTLDKGDGVGTFTSMAFMPTSAEAVPVVLYGSEAAGEMRLLRCGEGDCSSGSAGAVSELIAQVGVQMYGEFPELALDPQTQTPVVSFFNQTNKSSGALMLAQCKSSTESATSEESRVCPSGGQLEVQTVATGKCGYGRDTSIAFLNSSSESLQSNTPLLVSFLDYQQDGRHKIARLAVVSRLTFASTSTPTGIAGMPVAAELQSDLIGTGIDICKQTQLS
jgi:hypothetical protein